MIEFDLSAVMAELQDDLGTSPWEFDTREVGRRASRVSAPSQQVAVPAPQATAQGESLVPASVSLADDTDSDQ